MEYVSLLPPEIKAKRTAQQRYSVIVRVLLILLLLVAVTNAFLMVSSIFVRQDLGSLESERESLEQQAAALAEYQDLYNRLTARENMVGEAMGTVPPWSGLLREASRALQAGTWLSTLNLSYADDSGDFTMNGWAYNHSGVAAMLDQLYTIDQLAQVQVSSSTDIDYQGMEAVQFQVNGQILTGPAFILDEEDDQNNQVDQDEQEEAADQNGQVNQGGE